MKTRLILLFAVATLAFTSCSDDKNLYEDKGKQDMTDLIIPGSFDWIMDNNVICNFTTSVQTPIEVYTNADCNEASLVAEYTLSPDQKALVLTIPNYLDKIYVKVDGKVSEVAVVNGKANLDVPATTRAQGTDMGRSFFGGTAYYPGRFDMATVMFEDYFPTKGDYDFNDFVINYRYAAGLTFLTSQVESIEFEVKVRALGGLYDYAPYLRIIGAPDLNGKVEGAEIISNDGNGLVLAITGYTEKPEGAKFLNTDPEETQVAALKTVKIKMNFHVWDWKIITLNQLKFDFFLKGEGSAGKPYEIHQRGFAPIDPKCYPSGFEGLGSTYYTTNDYLVWGFNIPANVGHATEGTSFLKAYPKFVGWAESAGTNNKDWYKYPVGQYMHPVK